MYLIYKYTSPSGKVYIGQCLERREVARKAEHKRMAKLGKGSVFHRAINKYGFDSFVYEVIVKGVPSYFISAFEMYWINYYNSCHGEGYNSTEGGELEIPNKDTRRKMSIAQKGKVKTKESIAKMVKARIGTKRSEATKNKISETTRKRWANNVHPSCRAVIRVDDGKEYKSLSAAAKEHSVSVATIQRWCNGKPNTVNNYTFKYKEQICG